MQDKEKVYFATCSAILKLEMEVGHLQWSISDVARTSGVTRSLIYYYFGKEKEVILKEAYSFILQSFFTPSPENRTRSVTQRLKSVLRSLEQMPYFFVLYYLHKNTDSEIGQMMRKGEKELLNYLQSLFPQFTSEQILELYLKELGAIAFNLPPQEVDTYFKMYNS